MSAIAEHSLHTSSIVITESPAIEREVEHLTFPSLQASIDRLHERLIGLIFLSNGEREEVENWFQDATTLTNPEEIAFGLCFLLHTVINPALEKYIADDASSRQLEDIIKTIYHDLSLYLPEEMDIERYVNEQLQTLEAVDRDEEFLVSLGRIAQTVENATARVGEAFQHQMAGAFTPMRERVIQTAENREQAHERIHTRIQTLHERADAIVNANQQMLQEAQAVENRAKAQQREYAEIVKKGKKV